MPSHQHITVALALCLAVGCPAHGLAGETSYSEKTDDRIPVEPAVTVETETGVPDPAATAASLSIVRVDERLSATSDVAEVVGGVAGATVQRLGGPGDFSAVSIRGSTLKQVQVYLDGVPLNPDGVSIVNLSELPLQAFSRVEVYEGNAPLALGASPMGGVVNLVTRDLPPQPTLVSVTAGSFHTARVHAWTGLTGVALGRPGDMFLMVEALSTRGDFLYFDDNGTQNEMFDDHLRTRSNNDKVQVNGLGRWRLQTSTGTWTVLERLLRRDEGIPGYAEAPARAARLDTFSNLLVAGYMPAGGSWAPRTQMWARWRRETFADPLNEVGLGAGTRQSDTSNLGARVHLIQVRGPSALGEMSLDVRRDGYGARDLDTGEEDPPLRRRAATLSVGATLQFQQAAVQVQPGVQVPLVDNRALESGTGDPETAPEQEEPGAPPLLWAVNPRLGLVVRPGPGLAFKGNAGRYLRPPDPTELFGDRGYIQGNPALAPEAGWQWDLGVHLEARAVGGVQGRGRLTGFWNEAKNLIVFVQNSQHTMRAVNVGRARVTGVESSISAEAWDLVQVETGVTWTRALNLSDIPDQHGNVLPRMPPWLVFSRTTLLWRSLVRVGYLFQFAAANYWDTPNINESAPRTLHSVFARCTPGPPWPSVEMSIANLTNRIVDVVPRDSLAAEDGEKVVKAMTDFVGYPLPGRTIMVTVRGRF